MEDEKKSPTSSLLERIFKLSAHKTNVKTELMAGLTTFVTMSYIMFLNPNIMSKTGMPFDGLFLATCLGGSNRDHSNGTICELASGASAGYGA